MKNVLLSGPFWKLLKTSTWIRFSSNERNGKSSDQISEW